MANQDVHNENDPSFSAALRRVIDGSQLVMLAHINMIRLEVKEDLVRALKSILLIGGGVIFMNGAWLSLMAFMLHKLNDHLSVVASLAIVGSVTGLIGAGLALAGVLRLLHQPKVEAEATRLEHADPAPGWKGIADGRPRD